MRTGGETASTPDLAPECKSDLSRTGNGVTEQRVAEEGGASLAHCPLVSVARAVEGSQRVSCRCVCPLPAQVLQGQQKAVWAKQALVLRVGTWAAKPIQLTDCFPPGSHTDQLGKGPRTAPGLKGQARPLLQVELLHLRRSSPSSAL